LQNPVYLPYEDGRPEPSAFGPFSHWRKEMRIIISLEKSEFYLLLIVYNEQPIWSTYDLQFHDGPAYDISAVPGPAD
jgi:hypothetical protein